MQLDPNNRHDRLIAVAYEMERNTEAHILIEQFNRGVLTVEDLCTGLLEIINRIKPMNEPWTYQFVPVHGN